MNRVVPSTTWQGLLLALLGLLLAACSSSVAPVKPATQTFDSLATINIPPSAQEREVAAQYGGEVVVFRPEAGFAVLGFERAEDGLELLALERNRGALAIPEGELSASGWTTWGGGWTTWGGGWTTWGGGGTTPRSFADNLPTWQQVGLMEAQRLAPTLGAGVKVAVLDTGLDVNHPALQGRLAPRQEWRDFVDGDRLPLDEAGGAGYGHGTAVAGVIAQVAPEVTLLPLRVLGPDGSGDLSALLLAIDWAIRQQADIIHMSLGTDSDVLSLRWLVQFAASQGVLAVASSGNSGDEQVTYPAAYGALGTFSANVLSVGSVDGNDRKSVFSTYGEQLELLAPGEALTTLAPEEHVVRATGTSFAAPVVSGALALALAEAQGRTWADSVKEAAKPIDDLNPEYRHQLGAGRLDIGRYLQQLKGQP